MTETPSSQLTHQGKRVIEAPRHGESLEPEHRPASLGTPHEVLATLHYDSFGNNPDLLTRADKRNIDAGRYLRASGDFECRCCGFPLRHHPRVQGALWLTRGCEGLVKL